MIPASDDSPRLFENEAADRLTRIHPLVVPVVFVPIIAWFGWTGWTEARLALVPLFLTGWMVWSLLEYWLHRTLFHWVPPFAWGERFHFIVHGIHHDWHQDKWRLVMPPGVSLTVASCVYLILMGLTSLGLPTQWVASLFAGILAGYLFYDMVHYYVHHFKPKNKWLRALRTHHLQHHHNKAYQDKKFGVSMMIWDRVFGTFQ